MKKNVFILFVILQQIAFSQCDSLRYTRQVFNTVTKISQIKFGNADPYGLVTSQDLYLDFYEPFGDTLTSRPLIVYAFGGGFLIGDKNQPPIPAYCEYYAKCGYAVAAIDYRIGFNTVSTESAERAVYRAAQDLRAAVRFLAQRSATYRIDTAAIFLTGSSAGCFSGLHSTYMDESQKPASTTGIFLEPDDLGCFDCSTNADNNRHMPKPRGIINHWGAIIDTNFIVNTPQKATPVISFHGTNDNAVPYNTGYPFSYPVFPTVHGSNPIHRRLTNLGIKNKLVPLVGEGHEPWLLNSSLLDTAYKYTLPFLYEIMQPQKPIINGATTVCENDTITYSVALHSGSSYCWSVNGAAIISLNNNTIQIKPNGLSGFTISVKESDKMKYVSQTATIMVNIVNRPIPNFGLTANELTVTIVDSSQYTTATSAAMGNGAIINNIAQAYTYPSPGTYTVTLTATNGICSETSSKTITIDSCPKPAFSYTMQGNTVTFTANPSNAQNTVWVFGDGDSAINTATIQHTFAPGTYLVGLWETNSLGCRKSAAQLITIAATGIENIMLPFSIFPNPANDIVYYQGEKCSAAIQSIDGKILLQTAFFDKIVLSDLPPNIYLLQLIFDSGESHYFKLIKE